MRAIEFEMRAIEFEMRAIEFEMRAVEFEIKLPHDRSCRPEFKLEALHKERGMLKRWFDITFALVVLLLLAPWLVLVALLIMRETRAPA
ncbi:MAG: sugar transferase [Kouleothrix sp.]|nr:sugar transferase [Kouleothrix sp.]